jgi:hypothetical protein
VQFATGGFAGFPPTFSVGGRKPLIMQGIFISGAALASLAFLML